METDIYCLDLCYKCVGQTEGSGRTIVGVFVGGLLSCDAVFCCR
jgi:hypothetical protein